jgi:prepilin-type N-terminal cleavage/methylation domain-containing protein
MTAGAVRHRRDAGFTMVELMVTVVIIGFLAYFSAGIFKSQPVADGTRRMTAALSEARQRAISGGMIRDDVRAFTGNRARTQIEFSNTIDGTGLVRIWEAVEDPEPAKTFQWVQVGGTILPRGARIHAVGATAATLPGGALPTPLVGVQRKSYYPDGTCDGLTVYLGKSDGSNPEARYRVFAMPLSGTPAAFKGW